MTRLFDVRLSVWKSFEEFRRANWFYRLLLPELRKPCPAKIISGAYTPFDNTVHLFVSEILGESIGRSEEVRQDMLQNFSLVLIHELIHSLDIQLGSCKDGAHLIDKKKYEKLSSYQKIICELYFGSRKGFTLV